MNIKQILVGCILSICFIHLSFADRKISGSSIDSEIKNKIQSDPSLNGTPINIKTSNRIVDVSGKADSYPQVNTTTTLAQSTGGVRNSYSSHLTIRGSENPLDGSVITAKIKEALIQKLKQLMELFR